MIDEGYARLLAENSELKTERDAAVEPSDTTVRRVPCAGDTVLVEQVFSDNGHSPPVHSKGETLVVLECEQLINFHLGEFSVLKTSDRKGSTRCRLTILKRGRR